MILSGHIKREEALERLKEPYKYNAEDVLYVLNKLGLSKEDFNEILSAPIKSFKDYPTYYPFLKTMKPLILVASKIGILPKVLYYKFFT